MVTGHISNEDLALYAMQALSPEEMQAAREHIRACAECKLELALVHGDLALLALSAPQEVVPVEARARLLAQISQTAAQQGESVPTASQAATAGTGTAQIGIAQTGTTQAGTQTSAERLAPFAPATPTPASAPVTISDVRSRTPGGPRSLFGTALPWALAAGLACGAGYFAFQKQALQNRLDQQAGDVAQLEARAQHSQQVLDVLTSPSAQQVTLVAGKNKPAPSARASYLRDRGALVFIASNLNPLPDNKTYELWIIPADGKPPVAVGLFRPDATGSASVLLPTLQAGIPAKAFGVTIENPEGSSTPTMPVVLAGAPG